jgi:plasmid replication initiation protein
MMQKVGFKSMRTPVNTESRHVGSTDVSSAGDPYRRSSEDPEPQRSGTSERAVLPEFRALPGELATRDAQDLMAYPFFSLAKTKRVAPIHFNTASLTIQVEATAEFGMATIWDADVLIWAASQLVEARDRGLPTSRLLVVTPYEILTFSRRGTSVRDYQRLKAALDRLQSTTVATSIRQPAGRRLHRFSWINEWTERADAAGRPLGLELVLPDWFYRGLLEDGLVLTIDSSYFGLTGGIERWLYRLVRKHAGRQTAGWHFDFRHLHAKSGSLADFRNFAIDVRKLVERQALPGYQLTVLKRTAGEQLLCRPLIRQPVGKLIRQLAATLRVGDKP